MFRFASPYYFLLLAFIPLVIFYRSRRQVRPVMGVSALSGVRKLKSSPALRFRWIIPALKYGVFCLLILALARPQWGTRKMNVMTEGINIILAVDLSGSMAALDFRRRGKIINRLEAVKGVVENFVQKRTGDRIGLVVFGTNAYTQLPLTRDYNTIVSILNRLEIGMAGKSTAIGDAIGISLKRLEDIHSKSNIIILLTDGSSNAGELPPDTAAEIAAEKKVKIYTVGVGTRGKAPFLVRHPIFGDQYVYQETEMDEDTLRRTADKTGGMHFRAEDTEGLEKIYETIDKLEKTEVKVQHYAEYREFYPWFLIPAFVLLICRIFLINTRFLRVP